MLRRRVWAIPPGAFCEHRRMRYTKCEYCPKPCAVECPDCGLGWMLYEGDMGYYYAGARRRTAV